MSNGKMEIGKAYTILEKNVYKLCADINNNGKNFTMYFEFPEKYSECICDVYADPFVLMALEYAMAKQYDIICEQPMTDALYYQMTNYFIPLLAENTETFNAINLYAQTVTVENFDRGGVGTGLSCGVDSLNTVLKYKDFYIKKYKLTHLMFLNNGALGTVKYAETKKVFEIEKIHLKKAADELGIELISVNTNMVALYEEIANHRANNNEGLKIASVVYAMRKLFSIYYIASSFGIERFKFSDHDVGFFAPFTADMLSSDIRFYVGDLDTARRIDKIKAIAENRIAQRYLHVNPIKNCGKCEKCIRTMAELWVLDKLDAFDESFDVKSFRKHFIMRMSFYFAKRKEWEFGYAQEIISEAKKRGKYIPLSVFILAFFVWKPRNFIVNLIKKTMFGKWLIVMKHKFIHV